MENLIKEDALVEKWKGVLEHESVPAITDSYKKKVTAVLLENQVNNRHLHEDTPTNVTGGVQKWDAVLTGMVRRATPAMIAFDVAGVQPMQTPTSMVFSLVSRYNSQSGDEALFNEADTSFAGVAGHSKGGVFAGVQKCNTNSDASLTVKDSSKLRVGMLVHGKGITEGTTIASITNGTTVVLSKATTETANDVNIAFAGGFGTGVDTATGEGDITKQMALSVEKTSVTAVTRALKAHYSMELAQDLQAVHGLDAESELINILTNEIVAEQNREFLRNIYAIAKLGAIEDTTIPGVFDLQADADGRWSAERFKGLHFAIERDANKIAFDTKRGKGNILIVSADVASALSMAGILDTNGLDVNVTSDWTMSTYVGNVGGMKCYVDPYAEQNFYMVGYKGQSAWDSGYFWAPYVPLQLARGIEPKSLQPIVGLKTRYGSVQNPLFNKGLRGNGYYRIAAVENIM